jgi:hypothetical protein
MASGGDDIVMESMESGWRRRGDKSTYWQGNNTLKIPISLHVKNRKRLVTLMGKEFEKSLVLLQGLDDMMRSDSDYEFLFRQDSNFHYLFGVAEPGCMGAVDTRTGAAILFVPRLPKDYAIWMGRIATLDDFKNKYEVDQVRVMMFRFFPFVGRCYVTSPASGPAHRPNRPHAQAYASHQPPAQFTVFWLAGVI